MNHTTQPTLTTGKALRAPENEDVAPEPSGKERTAERRNSQTSEILQERIPTPPLEDDEYTLEAFGDISLSNIDFVPPPPTTLSPRKLEAPSASEKTSDVQEHKTSRSGSIRRPAGFTHHKIKAPPLSKGRINATDMSFASLVADWKQSREIEETSNSLDMAASRKDPMSSGNVLGPEEKQLIDLKNFGGEAAIPDGRSHDVVKNSGYTNESGSQGGRCAAERDENEAPASGVVPHPQKQRTQRGSGDPKRRPIPRWDIDSEVQSNITSRYKLT